MPIRFFRILLFFLAVLSVASSVRAQERAFPLRVLETQVVGASEGMGSILAARVGPDGRVYAVDHLNTRVLAFSPEGQLLWSAGRKGRGPGEFQLPSRVAVASDGRVYVLDLYAQEVTVLSSAGRYLSRARLPLSFALADNLLAFSGGRLVVAGVTEDPRGARFGLHRFALTGSELRYAGSFGPLPPVRDREVLRFWGAGALTPAGPGELLYSLRQPYEIRRYDPTGRLKSVLRPALPLRGKPEDAVRIERSGSATTYSRGSEEVTRPVSAWLLPNGWVLSGRFTGTERRWDLLGADGRVIGSRATPEEWGNVVGYDAPRGVLWVAGTRDDEPVLLRLRVALDAGSPPR